MEREERRVIWNTYFHGFIFSESNQLLPLLYSNPKKPKSPRIKIIGGLVSSSDWNEVCSEEPQLLAAVPPCSSLIARKRKRKIWHGDK